MPIDLYFSNQIEQLATDLAANLYPSHGQNGLSFDPLQIVVPNRNLAKWLQLTLARIQGVSMNIDYAYLDTALWDLLVRRVDNEPLPLPVSQDVYALALLRVFKSLPDGETVFNPIRRYLHQGEVVPSAGSAPTAEAHHWQLAAKLAHLFQEYELNRPEWIPAWRTNRFDKGGMMTCQGHLYLRTLQVCNRLSEVAGQPLWTLPQLAQRVLSQAPGFC